MPVHIRTGVGGLRLTLTSDGRVIDSQLAATPQEANRIAIMMIASRDAFDVGDTLTCRHANEGALAQLTKRIGYNDCERLSDRHDDGAECHAMLASIDKLRRALCEAGFAPR